MRHAVLAALPVLAASVDAFAAPPVSIADARLRVRLPAAGYVTLVNHGARPLALVGAASRSCGDGVMLHRSTGSGGMSSMTTGTRIVVPAGGTLRFAPGDTRLMCVSPHATPGGAVPMTLSFEGGAAVTAPFHVVGARG